MVAMEFLSRLHTEVKWNLRDEFPELIAKLGDLENTERFPIGLNYCLDVVGPPLQLHPTVKPSMTEIS
jgi:hypothetical protein